MPKKFTLGKKERLKSRKAIEALFTNGKSFPVGHLRTLYRVIEEKELQLAVGVSARHFKKAVERNRIKRLIKESYRLEKLPLKDKLLELQKGLHVFISYTGRTIPTFQEIRAGVLTVINKLVKTIHENSATHT